MTEQDLVDYWHSKTGQRYIFIPGYGYVALTGLATYAAIHFADDGDEITGDHWRYVLGLIARAALRVGFVTTTAANPEKLVVYGPLGRYQSPAVLD